MDQDLTGLSMAEFIECDSQGGIVIPGHPHRRFVMHDLEDGSVLLASVGGDTGAQRELDETSELQQLLDFAATCPTTLRTPTPRDA